MALIALEALWETQSAANTAPVDPFTVTVPASGWTSNQLSPFGAGTLTGLGLEVLPNTVWTRDTGLWMRRFMNLSGQAPVLITGNCEQALYVYFDGEFVGTLNPANAARSGIPVYNVVIPVQLATSGSHTLAVLALDDNLTTEVCYVSLEADYAPPMIALQPEAPVTEDLTWFTDLIVARDGSEERLRIATSPRQKFEYSYPATAARKSLALNMFWGSLPEQWFVPIWSQARYVGAVSADDLTLTGDTESEYRDSGFALLWQDDTTWQIVSVDTVAGATLALSTITQAFSAAWLMPLRYGFIGDNVTRQLNGYEATFRVDFEITDNDFLEPAAPTQYLSEDLYTEETLLKGDELSDDIVSTIDLFDPGHGLRAYYRNWTNSKVARTHRVICEDAVGTWELRNFLHRRFGRYRAFWQPSFENDLRVLNTGTITTLLDIATDGYLKHASDRTHIAVEVDGVWEVRAITASVQLSPGVTRLTLSSTLNVAASAVSCVSWLGLKRLNTDRVQIRYPGGGTSEAEFRTLEIAP